MATKLDTEKPLFLGTKATREETTFGQIRKGVNALNNGSGVAYADLEAWMLANYTPKKSSNYGASFIKSYVRDAVNKFGYLSHEDIGAEYVVDAPAAKEPAEPKAKKLTKAELAARELLTFVQQRGEVNSRDELNESQITVETIVQETKKKTKTVERMIESLAEQGLATSRKIGESTYVYLTEAGFDIATGASADEPATQELETEEA